MAKPIKETPVLKGRDADKFLKDIKASQQHPIDQGVRDRIKKNFDKIASLIKR